MAVDFVDTMPALDAPIVRGGPPARYALPPATLATQVPHLELLELAGRGEFAEVWCVRDRASGRRLALKRLLPDGPQARAGRQLLEREAEVGQRVISERVVRAVDWVPDAQPPYLLREWLDGQTLESRLRRDGALGVREALWVARQCAQGLVDLLQSGFTHGDLKPSNVFLCHSGAVRLIDLGFAAADRGTRGTNAGREQWLCGTPDYLAPEALSAAAPSGAARDLYGLGVMLYRMLSGRLPYQGDTVADALRLHQQARPGRLRALAPHVPGEVEDFVECLLAKQPLRRGSGPAEAVQRLVELELAELPA